MTRGLPALSRRRVLQYGAFTTATLAMPSLVRAQATDAADLQLSWIPNSNQLGEVCASSLGYFREEGIDIEMHPGGPNNNGIPVIASGQMEIGEISGSTNLMLAVAQGLPVKAFAAGLQRHPFVFLSLEKNPVRKPEDLRGKKVGLSVTSAVQLKGVMKLNNIPEGEVEIVPLGNELTPLLTGQVDVVSSWLTNTTAIKHLGPDVVKMSLWDAGLKLYANVYYAQPSTIDQKPEMLAKFLRGAARGWEYAYKNRDEAVQLLIKQMPALKAADERAAADVILDHSFNDSTEAAGWATMELSRWEDQIELAVELGQLPRKPPVNEVVTLAILEATAPSRPKLG